MSEEKTDAILTISSDSYDLTKVGDLKKFFIGADFPLLFPMTLRCPCGKKTLLIRSLDDFPYKSKKCSNCSFYFIKIIKETNGKKEILI